MKNPYKVFADQFEAYKQQMAYARSLRVFNTAKKELAATTVKRTIEGVTCSMSGSGQFLLLDIKSSTLAKYPADELSALVTNVILDVQLMVENEARSVFERVAREVE